MGDDGQIRKQLSPEPGEAGFMEALKARNEDVDYSNLQAYLGGRLRQATVDPVMNALLAVDKGMSGEPLDPEDIAAITEFNMGLAGGGVTAALGRGGMKRNVVSQFPAFHGSPYKFKKFEDKAIGTGEGAQAFGYGHYLTDSPGIAKTYAEDLASNRMLTYDGKGISELSLPESVIEDLAFNTEHLFDVSNKITPKERRKELKSILDYLRDTYEDTIHYYKTEADQSVDHSAGIAAMENAVDAIEKLDPHKFDLSNPSPQLYETTVMKGKDPSEYAFLDFDKTLGEQSDKVKEALEKSDAYAAFDDSLWEMSREEAKDQYPDYLLSFYKDVGESVSLSKDLKEAGLSGIVYDAERASGGSTKGYRNYVVFDPEDITIESRKELK